MNYTSKDVVARMRRLSALHQAFNRELELLPHLPLVRREATAYADKISRVMISLADASSVLGVALQRMRTDGFESERVPGRGTSGDPKGPDEVPG